MEAIRYEDKWCDMFADPQQTIEKSRWLGYIPRDELLQPANLFYTVLVRRLSLSLRPNSVLWPRKLASLIIWIWLNWRRNMRLASLGIWANCHCIPMCLKCLRIFAMLPIRPGATWAQRLFWKMIKMISYIYPCKFAIRSEPQGAAFVCENRTVSQNIPPSNLGLARHSFCWENRTICFKMIPNKLTHKKCSWTSSLTHHGFRCFPFSARATRLRRGWSRGKFGGCFGENNKGVLWPLSPGWPDGDG